MLEIWDETRVNVGLLLLLISLIMMLAGLMSKEVPAYWFPIVVVLLFLSFFCFVANTYAIKKKKYWLQFWKYYYIYRGDRIRLSEWIESLFKEELRDYPEDQRIDAAELIFPQALLVWFGVHRYLLRERKIIDKEILQDFLRQIRSIREKKSVIDYGLNSIIKEMELSGELP